MRKFAAWFAAGNPAWQFGFALCSTLVVGSVALLLAWDLPAIWGWTKLAWEVARAWVGTLA